MGRDGIAVGPATAGRMGIAGLGLLLAVSSGKALAQQPTATPGDKAGAQAKTQPQTVPAPAPSSQPVLEEVVITATGTNISGITPVGSEEPWVLGD